MSQENPKVHHVYDGIEEHDNHLPNWWLGILWTTIVFAFGYWMYYVNFGIGTGQLGELAAEKAAIAQRAGPTKSLDDAALLALTQDGKATQDGAAAFAQNCAACHGARGEGLIGPNLTDGFWLHGAAPTAIHKVVDQGVLEKGMPAWGRTLGADRVQALTAYVLTLKGKNVPGKAPQGEPAQ